MLVQWLITGLIVAACLAYAIKTLAPKLSVTKSACNGCDGCGTAAKPCTSAKDDFQPVVFHKQQHKREAGET
ncbi:MAG: hypothetical protein KGN32_06685 [Burkholderiales bacterium]|nr:hypothetical protein [Burkholderiales bacterium]